MTDLEYQQYREEWNKLPEACIVTQFPLHLDVELTNRCDLKCAACPHHGPDKINARIPQDMDFELYAKIINEGSRKGLKSIKLNYGGEPLLYDFLMGAIEHAKNEDILEVAINSNFIFSDDSIPAQLIASGLDSISITDLHSRKQRENVKQLSTSKKEQDSNTPVIKIILRKNESREKWNGIADEIIIDKYFEYNLDQDFHPSTFKCPQPWQRFLVLADGTTCSCSCGIVIPEKILGNAWNFTLEELWNGKKMKFLRYCHEFGETHLLKQCRMCPARKEYNKEIKAK